jgi:phosphate:Na+ symporter
LIDNHSAFVLAIAGIAFFMYGMSLASENLQKLSANRIRDAIQKLSQRPHLGVFLGILLTVMIQSSGAVTSMLVGLGSAGVITLQQVMSVILGTTIGSTFTVQIISFNISQFGLPIFIFSFLVYFLTHKRVLRDAMAVFMGFGLVFWGLEMIHQGTSSIEHFPMFVSVLDSLKSNPFYTILFTAFFTAIAQSSAVTIGFAMTLAATHLIDLHDAVYWVYGANIGTTATALIAAIGGNWVGRQVAWAHCFYKVTGVLIFFPLSDLISDWIATGNVAKDIANFHTLYNVLAALIFYPGIRWGAKLMEKLIPPNAREAKFSSEYITKKDWDSPAVALAQAEREALRMGDIVVSMVHDSIKLFRHFDPDLVDSIKKRDDNVDLLNREIKFYITDLMEREGSGSHLHFQMMRILTATSDFEKAADVIDNTLRDLAQKKHNLKLEFSKEGWKELEEMAEAVGQIASLSLSAFQRQDAELAGQVLYHKRRIRKLEKTLRESHIERLVKNQKESMQTSSIHIDVLGEYRRMAGLLSNHVYSLLKESDSYNILPRRS